ncbi:putative nitroreductase [Monocercomonoides exilis]|uniref:putative nitroreductase n=1 Tax=Monocercomonoides exilis TaxID=2049356 RepID=UPI00355ABEA5|nr:putative nitroreductase [Monocercomonoides exilis]|eukprot:MONOS_4313.1-p1 / transcript=MONOS_4313.1 / gene=MONOS_4313 / organism=Monocercomonoides_exilis_PA203 / gene_product=nitroreductase / transcript_product=nitroreductase / location=Mono_scaffold00113:66726-67347(+) / protein_length=184 / sequence_SO=supercontig / SO=protein_coding / is_pseudo=false
MSVMDKIRSRRSCRKYDPKPVPKETIMQLIEAARLAPSGRNLQPWFFYVVTNMERNQKIGKEIEPRLIESVPAYAGAAEKMGVSNMLFYDAPVVIYCTIKKDGIDTKELDMGLALENLMLVAEELGLGTVPVGWAKVYGTDIVTKELEIPDDEQFIISMCVGYPDKSVTRSPKDRHEVVAKFFE